jgi:crotonobetainyl-CoA:carnitine CoA-transferase CaiB-like acyl-CoA transferase
MFKEYQISKMAESQFLSQARNTLSITLNLETPEGRELLKKLAVTVDVLIEDYPPGQFDEWGIGYLKLSQINPRLVYGWIGRWGQGGPPDDRMSRVSEYVAGEFLAMEILTALTYREHVSGRGQFVNATGAGAIMRTIEYRTPLSPLTEEPRSKSKWLGRPIGFDNEDVYRRMFGVKKDEFDRLKKEGVI